MSNQDYTKEELIKTGKEALKKLGKKSEPKLIVSKKTKKTETGSCMLILSILIIFILLLTQ